MYKLKDTLVGFIKEDFNWKYYSINAIFLIICIVLNYHFEFEDQIIGAYKRQPIAYLVMFCYYLTPFTFSIVSYLITHKRQQRSFLLKTPIIKNILCLFVMLSVYTAFYHHKPLIEKHLPYEIQYLTKLTLNNAISAISMFSMTYLYWKYMDNSTPNSFYGFTTKDTSLKPYFLMIIIMIPLITYASFQKDFLKSYPIYFPHYAVGYLRIKEWILVAVFEANYGFDFVATELFFRGLLILGLSRYMGRTCVIPMVTTYCIFHFGKPMGETISSIFGGYILGVLALRTRSIYGGIIIHLAVAYMMEIGGYLGNHIITQPK